MVKEPTRFEISDRIYSGRYMIRSGITPELINRYPETWRIDAEHRDRMHIATLFEGRYNCTCEDYRFHGGVLECKHICAVKEYKASLRGVVARIEKQNVSYNRDINEIRVDANRTGKDIVIRIST